MVHGSIGTSLLDHHSRTPHTGMTPPHPTGVLAHASFPIGTHPHVLTPPVAHPIPPPSD